MVKIHEKLTNYQISKQEGENLKNTYIHSHKKSNKHKNQLYMNLVIQKGGYTTSSS